MDSLVLGECKNELRGCRTDYSPIGMSLGNLWQLLSTEHATMKFDWLFYVCSSLRFQTRSCAKGT